MITELGTKLAIFGVKKFVEAKLGEGISAEDEFSLVGDIADILGENKGDITSVINDYWKRVKRNNSAQTPETAAEDFMNALDGKQLVSFVQSCHNGSDSSTEALSFARQCWESNSDWRRANFEGSIDSDVEKLCIPELKRTFLAIIASDLYQSNTGRRTEKKVDTLSQQMTQLSQKIDPP